jgi:hypothetical protein
MAVIVRRSTIIEGGALKQGTAWVPSRITIVDGLEFVGLSRDDRRLAAFCGVDCRPPHPLRDCAWLTTLATMRKEAINRCKAQAAMTDDGLADCPPPRSGGRNMRARVDLPHWVVLELSAFKEGDVDVPATQMKVLTDNGDHKRIVSIELTEANLAYVAAAVKRDESSGCAPHRRRRAVSERIVPDEESGQVKWNYQRSAPYCVYEDEDGRKRSKHMKPKTQEGIAEAVKSLQGVAASGGRELPSDA